MLTERQLNIRKRKIQKLEHMQAYKKLNIIEADELERLRGEVEDHERESSNAKPNNS